MMEGAAKMPVSDTTGLLSSLGAYRLYFLSCFSSHYESTWEFRFEKVLSGFLVNLWMGFFDGTFRLKNDSVLTLGMSEF